MRTLNFGLRGDIDDIMYCLKFHGAIVIGLALAKAQKSLFFTKMGIDRHKVGGYVRYKPISATGLKVAFWVNIYGT